MDLREIYTEAIIQELNSLALLIEFLVLEKKVLTFESDKSELDLYFKPNNHEKMNRLLLEYKKELGETA